MVVKKYIDIGNLERFLSNIKTKLIKDIKDTNLQ